jgi:hypothetical protein
MVHKDIVLPKAYGFAFLRHLTVFYGKNLASGA